jgi:hypothetical protein
VNAKNKVQEEYLMRISKMVVAAFVIVLTWGCGGSTVSSPNGGGDLARTSSSTSSGGKIVGFAFVDASVTQQHSNAKIPAGTKIYPPGSKLTGTDGCSTTRYNTDGLPIVIIEYSGRPTAGSVAVTRHPASGGNFADAPYYLDLNPGTTVQTLGPYFDNGTYDVVFSYDYNLGAGQKTSASYTLARSCPPVQ